MPTPRGWLAVADVNAKLYAVGGVYGLMQSAVEAYDPTTNTWTGKASMPTARYRLAAGAVGGVIYAAGGNTGGPILPTVEAYDPATDTWTTKASMPSARQVLAIGVVNGILYAVGGTSYSSVLAIVEAYDPSTDTWTTKAPMPTARGCLAVGVVNGIVYAVGGQINASYSSALATVEAYDPATDTWTTKASMPTARANLAVGVVNGILYAVGGMDTAGHVVATVEAYDPATDTWTTDAPMPTARDILAAGVVNGTLYTVGGEPSYHAVEAFRPSLAPPPPPPPPAGWPNEPRGFTTMMDEPFNALSENGWNAAQGQATNGSGLTLATDAGAPQSPPSVLAFAYDSGFQGGDAPGVEYYTPAAPVGETYFGFWWKASNPWQDHPADVNAIADLFAETSGMIVIELDGATNTISVVPEFPADNRNLVANARATPVVLGAWHRIEWYVKYSTKGTSRDGVTRWWLDGVLQGEYTDLQMPEDAGFVEYDLSPTWGGVGGVKTETDFFWIDHAYISTPAASPPPQPASMSGTSLGRSLPRAFTGARAVQISRPTPQQCASCPGPSPRSRRDPY